MAKKQFKAESKRLLDMMINSIYTHKEIFLRELISNASDAMDKLSYTALTDDSLNMDRIQLRINVMPDKETRTLTITDSGIGMSKEELENNLGTIAKSGSFQFKSEMEKTDTVDIIGQFGVGFYSAFMVADHVIVLSRRYDEDHGWKWESAGADGYTISECEKDTPGTMVILHLKEDTEADTFSDYLDERFLATLIKKYSDYIRYPICMEMDRTVEKPRPEDAGEDYEAEFQTIRAWNIINSRVPLWQRPRSKVTPEEYAQFYCEKFADQKAPLSTITASSEGSVTFKAMLFIPSDAPDGFYGREFDSGLQLYSSGVLIMDKCGDLLPDCFRFVRGVVDSPDFSLNISREMLQHDGQLKIIAKALEKKVKNELTKIMKEDRTKYETFWRAFGRHLKAAVMENMGKDRALVKDLLLFPSSKDRSLRSMAEYRADMPEEQEHIYYASADSIEKASKLPQVERILDKGYEIFYLTEEIDEFVMKTFGKVDEKEIKFVGDSDAITETEEEKAKVEQLTEENKDLLDFAKETLGSKVRAVKVSSMLKSATVCLSSDGPLSIEMEKYIQRMNGFGGITAGKVLEINPDSQAFKALRSALDREDKELAAKYVQVLYHQALLIADIPLRDAADYTELVCSLMQ